ncbi:MAG: hypothetical protein ACQR33_03620 [Candidatus Saccharibacteria bacterium]
MGLISYIFCLLLVVLGCAPGMFRAAQIIRGKLRNFECVHLVGELFLQGIFCGGALAYLALAHAHAAGAIVVSSLIAVTGVYLFVGMLFVTGENTQETTTQSQTDPHPHAKLGWPLMAFQLARLLTMFILMTLSLH